MKKSITYKVFLVSSALIAVTMLLFSFTLVNVWQTVDPKSAAKELQEINKRLLKNEKCSFNISYTSYKEHLDKNPYETIYGFVIRDGRKMYSKINGAITIQNNDIRIVIDSIKRSIKLTNPLEGPEESSNISDYVKTIESYKEVKRKEENKVVAYRFEPKTLKGVVAQEIYINENFLSKTVTFYINDHTTRQNNELIKQTVFPRLEITITDFKKLNTIDQTTFNEKQILEINGDKVILKEKYRNFKFFDGRYKK